MSVAGVFMDFRGVPARFQKVFQMGLEQFQKRFERFRGVFNQFQENS